MVYLYHVRLAIWSLMRKSCEFIVLGTDDSCCVRRSMKEEIRRTENSSTGLDGSLPTGLCVERHILEPGGNKYSKENQGGSIP